MALAELSELPRQPSVSVAFGGRVVESRRRARYLVRKLSGKMANTRLLAGWRSWREHTLRASAAAAVVDLNAKLRTASSTDVTCNDPSTEGTLRAERRGEERRGEERMWG